MSMWEVAEIVCIILAVVIVFVLYCCIRVGADADERMGIRDGYSEDQENTLE